MRKKNRSNGHHGEQQPPPEAAAAEVVPLEREEELGAAEVPLHVWRVGVAFGAEGGTVVAEW